MTLKYEGKFEIGQTIKAYDHEPMEGRRDRFVEGIITGLHFGDFYGYKIEVTKDATFINDPRTEVIVPFESSSDYDNRVTLVS